MASSEYIITSNNVYIKLNEFVDSYKCEAELISSAKCDLLNYGKLEDFDISDGTVYVYGNGDGYTLEHDGVTYNIKVEDSLIIDYSID